MSQRLRSMFDSTDFAQRVWLSFFQQREDVARFDRPEELVAFLTGMAKRKVAAEVRDRLVRPTHNINRELPLEESMANAKEIPDRQPAAIESLIQRERWERFLSGQPERDQRIIQLRLQRLNHRQVANRLGIAINTVRRFWEKLLG